MSTTLDLTFHQGDRLRKAREVAGYSTYKEFADAIGMHPNTVANLEAGKHRARKMVIKAWADVTRVPISWLENQQPASPVDVHRRVIVRRGSPGKRFDSSAPGPRMDLSTPRR